MVMPAGILTLSPEFEKAKADLQAARENYTALVEELKREQFKYSYGRAVYSNVAGNMIIKLPIKHNSDGSVFIDETHKYSDEGYVPDWEFMENYIKTLPYGDRLD